VVASVLVCDSGEAIDPHSTFRDRGVDASRWKASVPQAIQLVLPVGVASQRHLREPRATFVAVIILPRWPRAISATTWHPQRSGVAVTVR
jgi:hypothetical protein